MADAAHHMATAAHHMATAANHMAGLANHLAGLANCMEKRVFGTVFSIYGCFCLVLAKQIGRRN
jgi:succinate-acetate transporter protein